ncbi:MAG: cohesin domain-containing protein, partial [bacterium]
EIYSKSAGPGGGGGEISYIPADAVADYGYSFAAKGEAVGLHCTGTPGSLTKLGFYIVAEPATFEWRILDWTGDSPGSVVLAQGTTTPAEPGWHYTEIEPVPVSADFVVAMHFLEDSRPHPGAVITGRMERFWQFSGGEWLLGYNILMFKAFLASSPLERLTENAAVDRYPSLSPDENRIAFVSDRSGTMDIWIMDTDGQNAQRLTDGVGTNTKPTWSPDGEQIAFVSDRNGNEDIFTITVDEQSVTTLVENEANDTDPSWYERGNRVLFSSDRIGGKEIYLTGIGAAQPRRLTLSAGDSTQPDAGFSAVSPNGASILAVDREIGESDTQFQKYLMIDGEDVEITIESGIAPRGGISSLNIDLNRVQSLGNLAFDVTYNPLVVSLVDMLSGTIADSGLFAQNPDIFASDSGLVRFNWVKADGFTGDGTVLQLTFEVRENMEDGEFPVTFRSVNAYDIYLNEIPVFEIEGKIIISESGTGVSDWMIH